MSNAKERVMAAGNLQIEYGIAVCLGIMCLGIMCAT